MHRHIHTHLYKGVLLNPYGIVIIIIIIIVIITVIISLCPTAFKGCYYVIC
jgi:hypothetical protein